MKVDLAVALFSIVLGAVGQFVLKLGANQLPAGGGAAGFVLNLLKSPQIYLGLALFGASFVLWVWVLTRLDLSRAYPLLGLSHLIVLFLAFTVLKEPVTSGKLLGTALIILGVLLINR